MVVKANALGGVGASHCFKTKKPISKETGFLMADSEGFEPSIPDKGYASLAGRWFQPTHPTVHMQERVSFVRDGLSTNRKLPCQRSKRFIS